jgi:hypothetical protein
MQSKPFYLSKINWLATIAFLIELQSVIENQTLWDIKSIAIMIISLAIVACRLYFTNTTLK